MIKKKRTIIFGIILPLVIIAIVFCASYIFKNKHTIYIPKSLSTNLYSTKYGNYYKDVNLQDISVTLRNPYSQQFYDDTQESKKRGKEILDYLDKFNIKEIYPIKFLNNDSLKNFLLIRFYYEDRFIEVCFPNKFVIIMKIVEKNSDGSNNTIQKSYLIKDDYIDENKIENIIN